MKVGCITFCPAEMNGNIFMMTGIGWLSWIWWEKCQISIMLIFLPSPWWRITIISSYERSSPIFPRACSGLPWHSRRFNNRHFHSGHLFQGRFKSIIVENDSYLLRLSCYIHRNPLRAGAVSRLAEYPWSSYKGYAYGVKAPEWLLTRPILAQFDAEDKHRAYREKAQQ